MIIAKNIPLPKASGLPVVSPIAADVPVKIPKTATNPICIAKKIAHSPSSGPMRSFTVPIVRDIICPTLVPMTRPPACPAMHFPKIDKGHHKIASVANKKEAKLLFFSNWTV
jgi:hypothetical protein